MKKTRSSFLATAMSTAQQSAIRGGESRFDQLKETMLADADSETFDR